MRRPEITHPAGAVPLGPDPADAPWLVPVETGWELDLGDLSGGSEAAVGAGVRIVTAATEAVARAGGGDLRLWARDSNPVHAAVAERAGMHLGRELLQMRRPLPVAEPWHLDLRPFVVGVDEAAWLKVNNRAFEWHPEQGQMTLDELQGHEAAAWFDPTGFLLHEDDGVLVGFCWTKVHTDLEPPVGEIYVIAVDPTVHQRGLGRQLVLAGLDHLHRRGLTIGMLYTEGDNEPAVHLYRQLGFSVHSTDRAYAISIASR